MPCNSPNKVFYTGINPETGKKKIFYTSRFVDYIWRYDPDDRWKTGRYPGSYTATYGKKNEAVYKADLDGLKPPSGGQLITESDLVPCGQCIGCRLDYSRSWAARCMLEAKSYPKGSCWFVTFTFDDEHLPPYGRDIRVKNYWTETVDDKEIRHKIDESKPFQYWDHVDQEVVNAITGEIKHPPFRSVSKKTHTNLMKKIRNNYGKDVRFLASWEYGSKSFRPHGHYLFFGLQFNDLVLYANNWRGDPMYNSDTFVEKVWSDKQGRPLGHVVIAPLSFDSANYVARYTLKKAHDIQKDEYLQLGVEPEFVVMSRKPGIGKAYFDNNYEVIYECDEIIVPGADGAITLSPPPYYDTLLERIDPKAIDDIKAKRRIISNDAANTLAYRNPGIDMEDVYESADRRFKNKVIFKKKGVL